MEPIASIKYPDDLCEPFAQVTLIDALFGDANLIDLCQTSPAGPDSWRRVLIDTGPVRNDLDIVSSCWRALVRTSLPQKSGTTDPPAVPPLNEFQVTHIDTDHIGNAPALAEGLGRFGVLQQWKLIDPTYNCLFVFPHVPPSILPSNLWLQDSWRTSSFFQVDDANVNWNQILLRLSDDFLDWARDLFMFGYKVSFRMAFMLERDDFQWERTTIINDAYGAEYYHLHCAYTETFRNQAMYLTLYGAVQITDLEHRNGPTVATTFNDSVNLSFSNYVPWVPSFVGFPGNIIAPQTGPGLPPLPSAPTFDNRTPQFRRDENVDSGPLSKLGAQVRELQGFPENLVSTTTALNGMGHLNPINMRVQYYVNPQQEMYYNFGRYLLIKSYSNQDYQEEEPYNADKDDIATNRSSTVTLFRREDLGLQMLFTADAYDSNCDIRRTILEFDKQPIYLDFGVLKIPHHGSQVTVDSTFYAIVRAEVYLICADHDNSSRNPRLSTLVAIVKSFRGRTRSSQEPFRIFCSSPNILEDYPGRPSAVKEVLTSPTWRPKMTNNKWDYEVYCPPKPNPMVSKSSRVLFVAPRPVDPTNPRMGELWQTDEWVLCNGPV